MGKRLVVTAACLSCALALLALFRWSAVSMEWIASAVARPLGRALGGLSARTSLPIGEMIVVLGAGILLWEFIHRCRASLRLRAWAPLFSYAQSLALVAAMILLSYTVLWSPLHPERSEPRPVYTLSELTQLCRDLTAEANRLRANPLADANHTSDQLIEGALKALDAVSGYELGGKSIKPARYPELFGALGIAGVYLPWTGEAIVNMREASLSLPFVAAHEAAHQAGYAGEDQANYLAYLACREGDAHFRYSGALHALYYAMEALHDADTISWSHQRMQMSQAVQRDYYRMNGLRNAEETGFIRLRSHVKAAFQRITRQRTARSYGDMVDLLLRDQRKAGISP